MIQPLRPVLFLILLILSTGWGDSITPGKLQELHASALLSKPFSHQDVSAALSLALDSDER